MSEIDYNDSFQPIIDFPNFLLIVLKITRMQEKDFNPSDFTLDDKELINEFDKVKLTLEFVKQFAYNLLLAKYYLDNYMVHHIMVKIKPLRILGNYNITARRASLPTWQI